MTGLKEVFGSQVRALRKERRWTQAKLAEQAGLSLEMIGMLERAQAGPSLYSIEKLSEVLEVPSPVLLGQPYRRPGASAGTGRDEIVGRIEQMLSGVPDAELKGVERVIAAVLNLDANP